MSETLTIRTASSTEVIQIASVGPQGPKGDKGDPGDVAGLPLSTQGDLLYRGASENQRLPIGTTGQVLKISGGIPSWGNESGAVTSVNGATGAVTVAALVHSHQPTDIYCDALDVSDTTLSGGEPNGIYFRDGSDNGKAIYKSAQGYSLYWDEGEEEWVLGNAPQTAKYYIGAGDTTYPWQATSWSLGPQGSGDVPVVDQALLSNVQRNAAADAISTRAPKTGNASSTQVVLGNDTRLSDARTPSSTLAHAASHAAAGSDALAPSDIGAQSIFISEQLTLTTTAQVTLFAARAKVLTIVQYAGGNVDVVMPQSGFLDGDVFVFKWGTGSDSVVVRGVSSGSPITTISAGQQKRVQRVSPGGWVEVLVDTHTHPASAISDSTTAGRALLTGADSSAQRTSLGLGTAATSATGDFAAASHSHELTALAATGATNGHVLTANGSNGATFAALPASGVTSVTGTAPIVSSGGTTPAISVTVGTGANTVAAGNDSRITGAIQSTIVDAKGDLIVATAADTVARLPVGATNGHVLTVDSAEAGGMKWAAAAGGGSGGATNLWIPASAWIPRTTTGCGVDSREQATNKVNTDELLFDTATEEYAQALVVMPSNYNNSTITARFYWTAASGSGGVAWGLRGRAYADDDALDAAQGTGQVVADTFITNNDLHVTSATSAITLAGAPAANRPVQYEVYRSVANASDTLAVDARLLGVEIIFN